MSPAGGRRSGHGDVNGTQLALGTGRKVDIRGFRGAALVSNVAPICVSCEQCLRADMTGHGSWRGSSKRFVPFRCFPSP